MIVKFKVDHEVGGRVYLAGESRDFDAEMLRALVSKGVAIEHDPGAITDTATVAMPEDTPEAETQSEVKKEVIEPKPLHKNKHK